MVFVFFVIYVRYTVKIDYDIENLTSEIQTETKPNYRKKQKLAKGRCPPRVVSLPLELLHVISCYIVWIVHLHSCHVSSSFLGLLLFQKFSRTTSVWVKFWLLWEVVLGCLKWRSLSLQHYLIWFFSTQLYIIYAWNKTEIW